jgi:hypothetical protein
MAALETHGINRAACEAIRTRSLPAFVTAREEELQRQENAFLKKFGLEIRQSLERSDEEVDNDDDDA